MRNLICCAGQCSRQWRFRQSNPARAPLSRFPSETCESLWVQRRHTSRRSRRGVDAFCAALVLHEIRWPGSVRGHDRFQGGPIFVHAVKEYGYVLLGAASSSP
jgi:hypothetical protein